MPQQLSDIQVDELAADATDILHSEVFLGAIGALRDRYMTTLLTCHVATAEANTAHASLRVLNDVVAELTSYVNAKKMRDKYPKRASNG
jgi:hypothetical protein